MKKIIFASIAIIAIAGVVAFNVSLSTKKSDGLSLLALANVEALANGEVNPDCPNGCVLIGEKGCYCYGWYPEYSEYQW